MPRGERKASKNRNLDIDTLLMCKPMLREIEALGEIDREEQKAILGAQRLDGMPRASGHENDLGDVVAKADDIHARRLELINAYIAKVNACEMILQKIPVEKRNIARLLYVHQLPIWRVAGIVFMGETTLKRIKSEMEKKTRF